MPVRKEVSSMPAPCSSENIAEQFLISHWDPLHLVDKSVRFDRANGPSSYNELGSFNSVAIERMPRLSCFGSESLSAIMNSFTLPESGQTATALCSQDFPSTNELATDKIFKGKKRKNLSESGAMQSDSSLNVEAQQQQKVPIETVENSMEKVEKKQKKEVNAGVKDNADSSKEDYIHIRAKRGQATNSHSLAERVRREKISERMRLLQDIVPGCNKITGKAVMLDEIINYVQSLQRQVEFLSMKLATVDPEMNVDIEQIFTKDNLHSIRYGRSSSEYGYGPEIGTSHQAGIGIPSVSNLRDMPRTDIPQTSMPQISSSWDHEFQNSFQMGFIPNLHVGGQR